MKLSSLPVLIKRVGVTSVTLALGLLFPLSASAQAASLTSVDLELSLLLDVSGSVNTSEFNLQRQGYVDAFNNPAIISQIQNGEVGSIAVNLIYWAGSNQQQQAVEWTLIEDAATANAFANAISTTTRPFPLSLGTSISGALDYAVPLFDNNAFDGTRQVIDVSGDGSNNSGRSIIAARNNALQAVDAINGLTILNDEPNLDSYYRNNVIGGTSSFVVAVNDFSDFSDGITQKLQREIESEPIPEPSLSILGAGMVLGFGALMNRQNSRKRKKTKQID